MTNRGNKPTSSPLVIGYHLINYPGCSKHYNDNKKDVTYYIYSLITKPKEHIDMFFM